MSTIQKLRREVERQGGRLVCAFTGRYTRYICEAPEGLAWVEGVVRDMVCEWVAGPADWRREAIEETLDRLRHGLMPDPNPDD